MDRSAPSDTALGDLSVMALANEELRGAEAGDLSVAAAGPVAYGAAVADGLEPLVCDESFLQERLFLSTSTPATKLKIPSEPHLDCYCSAGPCSPKILVPVRRVVSLPTTKSRPAL